MTLIVAARAESPQQHLREQLELLQQTRIASTALSTTNALLSSSTALKLLSLTKQAKEALPAPLGARVDAVVERLSTVPADADAALSSLDVRVNDAIAGVKSKKAQLQQAVATTKTQVHEAVDARAEQIVDLAERAVDAIVPAPAAAGKENDEQHQNSGGGGSAAAAGTRRARLAQLPSKVTARTKRHVSAALDRRGIDLGELSLQQLKKRSPFAPLVHVDLIAYAHDGYDASRAALLERLETRLGDARSAAATAGAAAGALGTAARAAIAARQPSLVVSALVDLDMELGVREALGASLDGARMRARGAAATAHSAAGEIVGGAAARGHAVLLGLDAWRAAAA
eukprot:g6237.t1